MKTKLQGNITELCYSENHILQLCPEVSACEDCVFDTLDEDIKCGASCSPLYSITTKRCSANHYIFKLLKYKICLIDTK